MENIILTKPRELSYRRTSISISEGPAVIPPFIFNSNYSISCFTFQCYFKAAKTIEPVVDLCLSEFSSALGLSLLVDFFSWVDTFLILLSVIFVSLIPDSS